MIKPVERGRRLRHGLLFRHFSAGGRSVTG
jgi:hypothetical protein